MHISRQSVEIPSPLRGERVRESGWGLGVALIVSLMAAEYSISGGPESRDRAVSDPMAADWRHTRGRYCNVFQHWCRGRAKEPRIGGKARANSCRPPGASGRTWGSGNV